MVKYSKKGSYKKKSPTVKKIVRKGKLNRLVRLIKKVSLKQSETKHTHSILENVQLYHNVPNTQINMMYLTQGYTDDGSTISKTDQRIGDEIVAKGLSFKFWFANKSDRPNVMYKIIFFYYQADKTSGLPANAPYYAQGTSNYMIRDLDTEAYKVIKVVKFNLENNAQKYTGSTFAGAEGHRSLTVWLPFKNRKVKYQNSGSIPRFLDVAYTIVAYDSYGTLTTDNIASFAVNRKLYFKDP